MLKSQITKDEVFGLVRPAIDAHTLGINSVASTLSDCGFLSILGKRSVCEAVGQLNRPGNISILKEWIQRNKITRLGFSFRLDPRVGAEIFSLLFHKLRSQRLLTEQGGPLRAVYFAGLPEACRRVLQEYGEQVEVFSGEETTRDTLDKLGIISRYRPTEVEHEADYDQVRWTFAKELINKADYLTEKPIDRSTYHGFGTSQDRVVKRIQHGASQGLLPLIRAHVGAYLPNRREAVKLFLEWCRSLSASGYLDILSIGTSQLSQSHFGEDWSDLANGGGVPLNSAEEFYQAWDASRPMLVRTYAGTARAVRLAQMYEETVAMAWHALPFWWFCEIDGRGPHSVRNNLRMHIATLQYVAQKGKPFEPNIPHHFAFRGADDVSCVVSAVLAARTAKSLGVRYLVLQNMLNTPKGTWGVQDLAKARALLSMVRSLEDSNFHVFLQPRAGLDHFSTDQEKARIQLAAVSALMDDIEPRNPLSPEIVHAVSYCEGLRLADPTVIDESIKITRRSITEYRRLRSSGAIPDMHYHSEVEERKEEILFGAQAMLKAIETSIAHPYTAEGLYRTFTAGFFAVPFLWECREEFDRAVGWRTKVIKGSVKVVDSRNRPIVPETRAQQIAESILSGDLQSQALNPSSAYCTTVDSALTKELR